MSVANDLNAVVFLLFFKCVLWNHRYPAVSEHEENVFHDCVSELHCWQAAALETDVIRTAATKRAIEAIASRDQDVCFLYVCVCRRVGGLCSCVCVCPLCVRKTIQTIILLKQIPGVSLHDQKAQSRASESVSSASFQWQEISGSLGPRCFILQHFASAAINKICTESLLTLMSLKLSAPCFDAHS